MWARVAMVSAVEASFFNRGVKACSASGLAPAPKEMLDKPLGVVQSSA